MDKKDIASADNRIMEPVERLTDTGVTGERPATPDAPVAIAQSTRAAISTLPVREARLDTAEQARTAAFTMVSHLYGMTRVLPGFGSTREGNVWTVPLVLQPIADRILTESELMTSFSEAPVVGELHVSADKARLLRRTPRHEVHDRVRTLPGGENIEVKTPGLTLPVTNHEIAWRYVMWACDTEDLPEELVAGKAFKKNDTDSFWTMPISIFTNTGEVVQTWDVRVDITSGHVYRMPSHDEIMLAHEEATAREMVVS